MAKNLKDTTEILLQQINNKPEISDLSVNHPENYYQLREKLNKTILELEEISELGIKRDINLSELTTSQPHVQDSNFNVARDATKEIGQIKGNRNLANSVKKNNNLAKKWYEIYKKEHDQYKERLSKSVEVDKKRKNNFQF